MNQPAQVVEVSLQPGDFHFGDADTRIRTLLGSCVAITMWHPTRRIGGMCHYMLPGSLPPSDRLDGRYADEAMDLFCRAAQRHHTRLQDYQIKLFGGGNMFPELSEKPSVAERNVAAAYQLMARYNLHLCAQDLGRNGYRTVIFDIASGHVWVRYQCLTG